MHFSVQLSTISVLAAIDTGMIALISVFDIQARSEVI